MPYLHDRNWANWSREERFFCAVLFEYIRRDPSAFAKWVNEHASLGLDMEGDWEVGYEVAFYRDYLWSTEKSARESHYPAKRTFDLCLFGRQSIVIIEAKVFEHFKGDQNKEFAKDKKRITGLPGFQSIDVRTVALASSKYFENADKYAKPETLKVFDGVIKWSDLFEFYGDKLFSRADLLYQMKNTELLSGDPVY